MLPFPNGLMLMDGDKHSYHRGIMNEAFKKDPMQGYLDQMPSIISLGIDQLKGQSRVLAFPFFKNLTLRLATRIFFGIGPDEDIGEINKAITRIVDASMALPIDLPFTKFRKGIKGRAFLVRYFRSIIGQRRSNPGKDLFSALCVATDEEGNTFTDQEIIDHLIFFLLSAQLD